MNLGCDEGGCDSWNEVGKYVREGRWLYSERCTDMYYVSSREDTSQKHHKTRTRSDFHTCDREE